MLENPNPPMWFLVTTIIEDEPLNIAVKAKSIADACSEVEAYHGIRLNDFARITRIDTFIGETPIVPCNRSHDD